MTPTSWVPCGIHYNPIKARLAKEPLQCPWTSYREFVGQAKCIGYAQQSFILEYLGGSKGFAAFHAEHDDLAYLETEEDREKHLRATALQVIGSFCRRNSVAYARLVFAQPAVPFVHQGDFRPDTTLRTLCIKLRTCV